MIPDRTNESGENIRTEADRAAAIALRVASPSSLRTEGLCKRYKKRLVVKNVSIELKQGEVVGLLGPNGAGKTTTFFLIVGMIKPNEGKVFNDGVDISREPMYKRARMGIGYLPQEASVFRRLTVRENIMCILELMKLSRAERQQRCDRLMEEFGIAHVAKSKGYMLSGGERRRTEILLKNTLPR